MYVKNEKFHGAKNVFRREERIMKKQYVCLLVLGIIAATPVLALPPFSGTYAGNIVHDGQPLTYRVTFKSASVCSLQVAAFVNGVGVSREVEGTYSYDNTFFRLNAVFRNPRIPNVNSVQWVSVVSFNGDSSFNILVSPDNSSGNPVRVVFIKEDFSFSTNALAQSYTTLSQHIPAASRVAIVSVASSDAGEGMFYIDEITLLFVNARKFTVVDRISIDVVLAEQNLQTSGYVDDASAVSIGKFRGATVVITGNISGTGARKQLALKAISVKTAEILAMSSAGI
jgi:hypothetical protein